MLMIDETHMLDRTRGRSREPETPRDGKNRDCVESGADAISSQQRIENNVIRMSRHFGPASQRAGKIPFVDLCSPVRSNSPR